MGSQNIVTDTNVNLVNASNSLIGDQEEVVTGINMNNIFNTPILLSAITDNGCYKKIGKEQNSCVLTHSFDFLSPAFENGANSSNLFYDQRGNGFKRTDGNFTDIGSFEYKDTLFFNSFENSKIEEI